MNTRLWASALGLLMVLGTLSEAYALDAYRDRRGLYGGLSIGAGSGQADADRAKSHIGYNFRARIGGGVQQNLTLDAEFGWHGESYNEGKIETDVTLFTTFVGGNYFLIEGLYIRGMGGVAHISNSLTNTNNSGSRELSETGLGFGVGAGYEFFANADLAIGVGGDFQIAKFEDIDYTTINFGVTVMWY